MISIPKSKCKRVLICSDAANEADDAFAIVHAILSPTLTIVGMVAGHFGEENSNVASYDVMLKLAQFTNTNNQYPIVLGAERKVKESPVCEAGADLLIEESKKTDESLYVVAIGALSDIALALQKDSTIKEKIILIWVGGGRYPQGSHECNAMRDLEATNIVFKARITIHQIPSNAYKTILVPIAELKYKLDTNKKVSEYLFQQLVNFMIKNIEHKKWINPECCVLGDQGAIGVLLDEQKGYYDDINCPIFDNDGKYLYSDSEHTIRVYHTLNTRMIIEDMFSKIALFEGDDEYNDWY